ncbi:MAG: fumarate hydratase, partial [Candidatus Lokiarchaeota archaeon]|nr:fumarate hydratase [Candidatus Lokiarchaeota archaeon]
MVDMKDRVAEALAKAMGIAATRVRKDVRRLMANALEHETKPLARKQLEFMLANFDLGVKQCAPYCQDTGTIHVYASIGERFPLLSGIYAAIEAGIVRATRDVPLRPNSIDPVSDRKYPDNTGPGLPDVSTRIVSGDALDIDVLLKGGGSENMSRLFMLEPIGALERIPDLVATLMVEAGGKPCPPVIIGIGLGGGASGSIALAKKALLREAGMPHPDPATSAIERQVLAAVNATGIGPSGLGGDT